MLLVENVAKSYPAAGGRVQALAALSLEVPAGGFVAVRGPSGSGKSTLLMACGGMLRPDQGRILIGGRDVYALSGAQRARLRAVSIGFVFQRFHLVPYLDVLANIALPGLALRGDDLRGRALVAAERFGLGHRLRHLPSQLSVGERQRLALARALVNRPALILADEPTGNLDADHARVVLAALSGAAAEGAAVLLVTHDDRAAAAAGVTVQLTATGGVPSRS